jgi:hypothetical protein
MQWEIIVALVVAVPVILFPAAYVWYINIKGLASMVKEARMKKAAEEARQNVMKNPSQKQEYEKALIDAMEEYPWQFKQ